MTKEWEIKDPSTVSCPLDNEHVLYICRTANGISLRVCVEPAEYNSLIYVKNITNIELGCTNVEEEDGEG